MKKIIATWIASMMFMFSLQAQDPAAKARLYEGLQSYLGIKDALVEGDKVKAGQQAEAFVKHLNGISFTTISEGNVNTLLKDANAIITSKDIEQQRTAFSRLSDNMIILVKSSHPTEQPVYLQYCPMKKASWLSMEKNIKNPYYGNSMLTCGRVTETIQ